MSSENLSKETMTRKMFESVGQNRFGKKTNLRMVARIIYYLAIFFAVVTIIFFFRKGYLSIFLLCLALLLVLLRISSDKRTKGWAIFSIVPDIMITFAVIVLTILLQKAFLSDLLLFPAFLLFFVGVPVFSVISFHHMGPTDRRRILTLISMLSLVLLGFVGIILSDLVPKLPNLFSIGIALLLLGLAVDTPKAEDALFTDPRPLGDNELPVGLLAYRLRAQPGIDESLRFAIARVLVNRDRRLELG